MSTGIKYTDLPDEKKQLMDVVFGVVMTQGMSLEQKVKAFATVPNNDVLREQASVALAGGEVAQQFFINFIGESLTLMAKSDDVLAVACMNHAYEHAQQIHAEMVASGKIIKKGDDDGTTPKH